MARGSSHLTHLVLPHLSPVGHKRACYARRTLVGRSETEVISREVLTKRCNVLDSNRDSEVKGRVPRRSQAECLWTQEYTRLRRTRIENTEYAADYLYYETHKRGTS